MSDNRYAYDLRTQEANKRKEEREAEKQVALRLINVGYKLLRKQFRPIKGKPEPWERLLRKARARLKAAADRP